VLQIFLGHNPPGVTAFIIVVSNHLETLPLMADFSRSIFDATHKSARNQAVRELSMANHYAAAMRVSRSSSVTLAFGSWASIFGWINEAA
jgi:hypothetical protein